MLSSPTYTREWRRRENKWKSDAYCSLAPSAACHACACLRPCRSATTIIIFVRYIIYFSPTNFLLQEKRYYHNLMSNNPSQSVTFHATLTSHLSLGIPQNDNCFMALYFAKKTPLGMLPTYAFDWIALSRSESKYLCYSPTLRQIT